MGHDPERSTHDPFSVWLRTQLSTMYPDVLNEPLPGEIQKLALELEKKLTSESRCVGSSSMRIVDPRGQIETLSGGTLRYERKTV